MEMETEIETPDVAVREFQDVIDSWLTVRKTIDMMEDAITPFSDKRKELEGQILKYMEATGLENFQGRLGGVIKKTHQYVNQPIDDDRAAFITYLMDNGELDNVITFHAGRLTSWYKNKKDEIGFDFKPPGLGEMKERFTLSKKK